jgi:hypothetical protein
MVLICAEAANEGFLQIYGFLKLGILDVVGLE